jgi:plasmid replication initiation protein
MKNYTTTQQFSANTILKFLGNALKNFFQTGDNREFKRLKDFISS